MEGKGQIDSKLGLVTWLAIKFEESREIEKLSLASRFLQVAHVACAPVDTPSSSQIIDEVPIDFVTSDQARYLRINSKPGAFQSSPRIDGM